MKFGMSEVLVHAGRAAVVDALVEDHATRALARHRTVGWTDVTDACPLNIRPPLVNRR